MNRSEVVIGLSEDIESLAQKITAAKEQADIILVDRILNPLDLRIEGQHAEWSVDGADRRAE